MPDTARLGKTTCVTSGLLRRVEFAALLSACSLCPRVPCRCKR